MVLNKHQHKLEQNKKKTVYYIKHPISNRPHSSSARPGLCPKIQGITLSGTGQSKLGVTKSFRNLRIIFGDPEQIVESGGNCTVKSDGNKTFVCIAFACLTSSWPGNLPLGFSNIFVVSIFVGVLPCLVLPCLTSLQENEQHLGEEENQTVVTENETCMEVEVRKCWKVGKSKQHMVYASIDTLKKTKARQKVREVLNRSRMRAKKAEARSNTVKPTRL